MKGDVTAILGLLTSSYLNLLLLSVPLGYLAQALQWAPLLRFGLVIFAVLHSGMAAPAAHCRALFTALGFVE